MVSSSSEEDGGLWVSIAWSLLGAQLRFLLKLRSFFFETFGAEISPELVESPVMCTGARLDIFFNHRTLLLHYRTIG